MPVLYQGPLDQTSAGGAGSLAKLSFIDLMQFFTGSEPVKVYAECIDSKNSKQKNDDNISITLKFSDGSVGNLVYTANVIKHCPKNVLRSMVAIRVCDRWFPKRILYRNNKENRSKPQARGINRKWKNSSKLWKRHAMPLHQIDVSNHFNYF